jgi:DNA-binding FrmR family transcriptional regulator
MTEPIKPKMTLEEWQRINFEQRERQKGRMGVVTEPIKLPDALRLADALSGVMYSADDVVKAAAELRRLHGEIDALKRRLGQHDACNGVMGKSGYVPECISLRAEVERLREDRDNACKLVVQMHHAATGYAQGPMRGVVEDIADLKTARDRLGTEVERLREDAERYQWLRECARATSEHWGGRWSLVTEGPAPENATPAGIDAAIDAARAALKVTK